MTDTFILRRVILGGKTTLPLSQDQAARWRIAVTEVLEMVDVEQKFDIVLANLVELEQELASRALQRTFHAERSAREMLEDKQVFNRRLINILTATKLYVDQVKHHIKVFFSNDPQAWTALDAAFKAEYDVHLAYRVMEALRNYAQHRGLPLQGFTHASKWLDMDTPDRVMESNVALNLIIDELAKDGKFKAAVLTELQALGDTVDIKLMIRQYVEALGRVHTHFREAVKDKIVADRAHLDQLAEAFAALCSEPHPKSGLALVQQHGDGPDEVLDYYPRDTLDYLDVLQARSRTLANLSRRIITTAPLGRKS